ncbi:uncharacterized protein PHACADRAFT_32252 [Phanerochaete carnosa HHB-10118-sp]|uniref:Uncharacterized protein n=1 Tax=Phanerochaete carnosa (strain HHB-10118-sp) TaxID=650164 RepID=K5WLU4_PHACS|nr:uncharacterized protein PHACADRAFT_32252 [Phanerochaete carnosa HHB-10118-sp]EKM51257.1 hypothetical protein PHACADRAFT_32252 [Phanerochaete carnosa HHB-10118-sp]
MPFSQHSSVSKHGATTTRRGCGHGGATEGTQHASKMLKKIEEELAKSSSDIEEPDNLPASKKPTKSRSKQDDANFFLNSDSDGKEIKKKAAKKPSKSLSHSKSSAPTNRRNIEKEEKEEEEEKEKEDGD